MREVFESAFPASLEEAVADAVVVMPTADYEPRGRFLVQVEGEDVRIPERIYNPEPPPHHEHALPEDRRQVLACLYTRHHDGHVRQRHLNEIIHLTHAWVTPFVVRLIGEYVVEILADIEKGLADVDVPGSSHRAQYATFAAANPGFLDLTSQRVVSYWNCYYRFQFPKPQRLPRLSIDRITEARGSGVRLSRGLLSGVIREHSPKPG